MFATGGDYRVQSFITFSVVAVISACLLWLMVRLNGSRNSVLWTWVLANIALFSPIQFHNWLWPMQFAYFLPYTFLALCLLHTLCAHSGAAEVRAGGLSSLWRAIIVLCRAI